MSIFNPHDYHTAEGTIKVLILGDEDVGKTHLLKKYLNPGFQGAPSNTIGGDVTTISYEIDNVRADISIYDLAGHPRFSAVRAIYYTQLSGAMLVFDVTHPQTFMNLSTWIDEILANNKKKIVPLVLVGNKADLRDPKANNIHPQQAETYAKMLSEWSSFNVQYIETSAKTGRGVKEAFEALFKAVLGVQ